MYICLSAAPLCYLCFEVEGLSPDFHFDAIFGLLSTCPLSFCILGKSNKVLINQSHQAGVATQATKSRIRFLVAERSPTSRANASRVKQQVLHVCHSERKNPANQVPTNGRTCGRAFQGTIPESGMYKRSHP